MSNGYHIRKLLDKTSADNYMSGYVFIDRFPQVALAKSELHNDANNAYRKI